ncbi:hypothetical protein MASR2M64_08500 [Candidatus Cloacimonadota bacterium]
MVIDDFTEGEITISFPKDLGRDKLDEKGRRIPTGMSLADHVINTEKILYILEIKDFSCSKTPEPRKIEDLKILQGDDFISSRLTPTARDSYTFLHLMDRIDRQIVYIVLLGLEDFEPLNNKSFLDTYKQRLIKSIRREADEPWKREHISDCIVCNLETWNEIFPQWPVQRNPANGAT